MRDPFNAPIHYITSDRQSSTDLTRPDVTPSHTVFTNGNSDAVPWTPSIDSSVRSVYSLLQMQKLSKECLKLFNFLTLWFQVQISKPAKKQLAHEIMITKMK